MKDLAAVQYRRYFGRDPASGGWLYPARRSDPGAGARGARGGGEINRNTRVTAIEQKKNGEWVVVTDKGEITCEHVVSASGNFARQTGRMVGLDVPVMPVEHQYIVTEPHPAIKARKAQGLPEMGVLRESDASWYMREEAGGLLLGPYESARPPAMSMARRRTANTNCSRTRWTAEAAYRVGHGARAGVRRSGHQEGLQRRDRLYARWFADRRPGVGQEEFLAQRRPFVRHYRGGRAGWQLAHWIVKGEPSIDMMGVDPRRFGDYAGEGYLVQRTRRPMPRSSPPIIPTRSARPAGPCAKPPAMTG